MKKRTPDNKQNNQLQFSTIEEARSLAIQISKLSTEPLQAQLALSELFINSIEHGNLGFGFENKSELLANGNWKNQLVSRSKLEPYRNRFTTIKFKKKLKKTILLLEDMGKGFDFSKFKKFDSNQILELHGRGIALARGAKGIDFKYIEPGNKLKIIIR